MAFVGEKRAFIFVLPITVSLFTIYIINIIQT